MPNQVAGDGSGTDGEADDAESDGDGAADDVDADGDADADGDGAAEEVEAEGDGAADDVEEDGLADADGEASGAGSAPAPVVAVVTGGTVPAGVDGSKARTGTVGAAPGRSGTIACLAGVVSARSGVAVDLEFRGAMLIAEGSPVSCTPIGRADPAPATIAQHPTATAGSAAATVSRSRRRGRASEPARRPAGRAGGKTAATLVPAASSATASRHTDAGTAASGAAPMSSRAGHSSAGLPAALIRADDPAGRCAVATVTKSCSAAASRS